MDEVMLFASQKIKPYETDVSDSVDTNRTISAAVSCFVVIALASFCSPGLQTLHSSTSDAQHHREQFNPKGKVNLCVLAKTPTKLCIRKGGAQQPVQLFYSTGDILLPRINFPACSLCPPRIRSGIARGSLTLRERAPPV
jgi:hypothetical protein